MNEFRLDALRGGLEQLEDDVQMMQAEMPLTEGPEFAAWSTNMLLGLIATVAEIAIRVEQPEPTVTFRMTLADARRVFWMLSETRVQLAGFKTDIEAWRQSDHCLDDIGIADRVLEDLVMAAADPLLYEAWQTVVD